MFRKVFFLAIIVLLTTSFFFHPEILTITAGVSLFLFGMLCLEQGFRQASGGVLARIIERATGNRWSSYATGAFATSLLQSSSLSSVITVSFVSTRLVTLSAGLALVIGSGLGSTFGTWLMAAYGMKVAISHYAMPMLVMGTLLQLQKGHRTRSSGYILLGIGFLFLGIHYIREGMAEAGDLSLLTSNYGLLGGVLAGTVLTVLMQSSHALLVLVIAAMANQLLSLEQALALCIGTNIGTTTTAALASISATIDGRRLALGNLLFKLCATFIVLPFMPWWQSLVMALSQTLNIADQPMMQLALFHSLFNLAGALLIIPVLGLTVRLLQLLIPTREKNTSLELPLPQQQPVRAKLLTKAMQEHPDAALKALNTEGGELYQRTIALISFGLYIQPELLYNDQQPLDDTIPPWPNWRVGKLYKLQIRELYDDITRFADDIASDISPSQRESLHAILSACENFISAIKQLRLLQKSLRRNLNNEHDPVRKHYLMLRKRIIKTIRTIHQLADDETLDITEAVHALKKDLYKQDLLTGDSLSNFLKDDETTPLHAMQLINDNGTAHTICNSLIDGAVILLVQGERNIIRQRDEAVQDYLSCGNWSEKGLQPQ
ncbi:Na/Pi cotransporter family protein [Parendozoicomonas haliclonae]|uniref:Na+/Pi-cotransporter n=1 Tax=Parendozoicomonas haliclonae TaxID=1960125 RepID=A0A1X7AFY3_9GAMM|nr:Na/Pi symporter [Parendozoicomonas haliclonae]SMA37796.1 Na+/Pi-cotransporter [Parendozoicomonas haliclonae]